MNNNRKRLSLLLVGAILISIFGYIPVAKAVSSVISNNDEITFHTATLDDNFADNRILVLFE